MTAQGKDEVRHPGYVVPQKFFRPEGAVQNASTFFVRPLQGRKIVWGMTVTQGGDLRSYPGLS
jgi:hypothetical protein